MTLQEIHAEIKAMLPEPTFLVVQHILKNYKDGNEEKWECQAYVDHESPLIDIFMINRASSPEDLISQAREVSKDCQPSIQHKIESLKAQIAKLEGATP